MSAELQDMPIAPETRADGSVRAADAGPMSIRVDGNFERIVSEHVRFFDTRKLVLAILNAQKRTARILVDDQPKGTGFLVGDDLILTAKHVVEGIDGRRACAELDHVRDVLGSEKQAAHKVPFAKSWLVASSAHAKKEIELGPDGPDDAKLLDYALIRLAEPVAATAPGIWGMAESAPRGAYGLDANEHPFSPEEPIFVVGHPSGRPMELSLAAPAQAVVTKHGLRVRYNTNTEEGSSGSPVFNQHWRVVALHHAGETRGTLTSGEGPAAFNQGIPISLIVRHLAANESLPKEVRDKLRLPAPNGLEAYSPPPPSFYPPPTALQVAKKWAVRLLPGALVSALLLIGVLGWKARRPDSGPVGEFTCDILDKDTKEPLRHLEPCTFTEAGTSVRLSAEDVAGHISYRATVLRGHLHNDSFDPSCWSGTMSSSTLSGDGSVFPLGDRPLFLCKTDGEWQGTLIVEDGSPRPFRLNKLGPAGAKGRR